LLNSAVRDCPRGACCEVDDFGGDVHAPDVVEAGRLAARALLRHGTTELLHLRRPECPISNAHRKGFAETLAAAGNARARYTVVADQAAADMTATLRDANAIACTDETLAISAMLALLAGDRCPGRDVALIGFGHSAVSTRIRPRPATIDPCGREIGARAVETLLHRVERTRMDKPEVTHVAPKLVEGETLLH
jgi:DNA-binding LacI/PurR family transcriptional regulator